VAPHCRKGGRGGARRVGHGASPSHAGFRPSGVLQLFLPNQRCQSLFRIPVLPIGFPTDSCFQDSLLDRLTEKFFFDEGLLPPTGMGCHMSLIQLPLFRPYAPPGDAYQRHFSTATFTHGFFWHAVFPRNAELAPRLLRFSQSVFLCRL